MECFIGLISKKAIVIDMLTQRSAMYQISMKYKPMPFWLIYFTVTVYPCNLTGRHKNERPLLVVVSISAINHISTLHIFKENGIETKIHAIALARGSF